MDEQTERMYELMRKESNRLKTFQMNPAWPKDYVDIKKLAKAGFFYAFNGDKVHCAFCRGQVCKWDRDDDPMSEHARHFTTCPFIMGGEVGNEPLGEDPFPGPKRPRPYDVCGMYPSYPSPTNYNSRSACPRRPQVMHPIPRRQQAQRSLPQHNQSGEGAVDQFSYLEPYNYTYERNQNLDHIHGQPQPQPQIHTPAYDDDASLDRQTQHSPSNTSASSNCSNNSSSNSLNGICKICYSNSIELVFLPCGHSVSCLSCAQRLVMCPCCRSTITARIRTFLV